MRRECDPADERRVHVRLTEQRIVQAASAYTVQKHCVTWKKIGAAKTIESRWSRLLWSDVLVADRLRSYASAKRELGLSARHEKGLRRNNRAEPARRFPCVPFAVHNMVNISHLLSRGMHRRLFRSESTKAAQQAQRLHKERTPLGLNSDPTRATVPLPS